MTKKDDETLSGKADMYRTRSIEQRRWGRMEENERELVELIQSLDSKYKNMLIIVEGKRDALVLRNLGVEAPIFKTQSRLTKFDMIEKIVSEVEERGQVLILTDYDNEGKEICSFIERELERRKIKVLKRERRMIRKLMGHWRCIEEIISLFKRKDSPEASR
ncbi:toprim domain-containing protein [Candidatus Thorarchaeota archaeon]|nr:toprim domain-containing protein [Candidatus Thorarchaeota archaeon]TFG96489.1 MAG: toprim domain-containing protein [Candidatus Thorarchaeota archaeon]